MSQVRRINLVVSLILLASAFAPYSHAQSGDTAGGGAGAGTNPGSGSGANVGADASGSAGQSNAGLFNQEQLVPGSMLESRQQLLKKIQQARAEGVGIGGYLQALQGVESQVKGGADPQSIGSRIEGIQRSLEEQRQRRKILQTQKPTPPQGSQVGGSAASPSGGSRSGPAADKSAAVDMLKSKFGGNLDNINPDMLPESVREKLKDPETRRKLMEKFGHQ